MKFVEVKDKVGNIVLYDIFIEDKWIGSRRTLFYAQKYAEWYTR